MNDAKYIGMDVHQATISAAVRDSSGNLVMEATLETKAETIAAKRKMRVRWTTMQDAESVACDPKLSNLLREAVRLYEPDAPLLPSGAGHDAAALAARWVSASSSRWTTCGTPSSASSAMPIGRAK